MSAFECSFPLPHFPVSILGDEKSIDSSSLSSIRGDKAMVNKWWDYPSCREQYFQILSLEMRQVVDFWHSKCKWCPPALEKLNKEAGCADSDDIIFVSCALSQGEGDYEVASNLVTKGYVKVIQLLPTMMPFHSRFLLMSIPEMNVNLPSVYMKVTQEYDAPLPGCEIEGCSEEIVWICHCSFLYHCRQGLWNRWNVLLILITPPPQLHPSPSLITL